MLQAPYVTLNSKDKERYANAMASYVPPPKQFKSVPKSKAKKKKKKKWKDPNAPKRGRSAFIFFCSVERARLNADDHEHSFGDVGKLCADVWNALDEEARKPFAEQAAADRERYFEQMQAYVLSSYTHSTIIVLLEGGGGRGEGEPVLACVC